MATLTKLTDDVDNLADYTLYGGPISPIIETTLIGEPIGLASIEVLIPTDGAAIDLNPILIDFTGPNEGDQLIQISVRTNSTPAPIAPDRTTLIDVEVGSTERPDVIAGEVSDALTANANNSREIIESSVTGANFTFSPACGGEWEATQISGPTTTPVITQGLPFGTATTVTQTGVTVAFGSDANGTFNRSSVQGLGIATSTFNTGEVVGFSNHRNVGPLVEAHTLNGLLGMRIDLPVPTGVNPTLEEKIDLWIQINRNSSESAVELVKNSASSIDIYARDGSNLSSTASLAAGPDNFTLSVDPVQPSRTTTIIDVVTDPHKTSSVSQVRWFDPVVDLISLPFRVAPNVVTIGPYCTFNLDNFNLNLDTGFALDTRFSDDTTLNWDQVDYSKTGDSQGVNGGNRIDNRPLFTPVTRLTSNFNNCSFNFFPVIFDGSGTNRRSNFMFINGSADGVNIINWDNVDIKYSGNLQMDFKLINDSANSSITNSKLITDGSMPGTGTTLAIVVLPFIRLVEPFGFELQTSSLQFNSLGQQVAETFENSDFIVGANLTGTAVQDPDYVNFIFQNRGSFFKFLNFSVLGNTYINAATYSQLSGSPSTDDFGHTDYSISFDPSYFDSEGTDLSAVRVELRYGDSTLSEPLAVKEMSETGGIGGVTASIVRFIPTVNLVAGSVFTIPRPHGEVDITLTESATPITSGTDIQFTLGSTAELTFDNILAAVRAADYFGIWVASSPSGADLMIGNNIAGTVVAPSCDDVVMEATKVELETGADGQGTNTHPFEDGNSYIIEGLLNTNTLTDNTFKANTSTGRDGVGNNNGLFLTYNKTNYKNNIAAASFISSTFPYDLQYTSYEKRSGYRPQISTYNFTDGPNSFSKALVTDIYWEDVTKATADAYTRDDMINFDTVYRWIENETDDRTINNQDTLPSVYDRFISLVSPVDSGGLIDLAQFDVTLGDTLNENIDYVSGTGAALGTLTIPVANSIGAGTNITGITTIHDININKDIDFVDSIIRTNSIFTSGIEDAMGTIIPSNITNGTIRAIQHELSGSDITNSTIGPSIPETPFTINHSGGSLQDVVVELGGLDNTSIGGSDDRAELFTTDTSLHGLTANNIKIFFTGTGSDEGFSVDSPGEIINSEFIFQNLNRDINWIIDEDLSTCTATNDTVHSINLVLRENGKLPGTATGNFTTSRSILADGQWFYRLEDASDGSLITENFITPANGVIPFTAVATINAYLVRTDVYNQKPFIIEGLNDNASINWIEDINLDSAIQTTGSAGTRELIDAYTNNFTLNRIIDPVTLVEDFKITVPSSFNFDGNQQATSESYWNGEGGRGAGQYAFKILERSQEYGETVLNNLTTLNETGQTQLLSMLSNSRLQVNTKLTQLRSEVGATSIAFFPGQFINNSNISNFSIIDSDRGLVVQYQSASLAVIDEVGARQIRAEVGDEMNDRRVTRENINRLGILAPINDNDPE